jgi:hypothetical protein
MSSQLAASTTGKKMANWTVGKSTAGGRL